MAVHKVPYLEHLKQFGLRENALIGQVAQTAADAIEEQAEQITALSDKLDKLPGIEGKISVVGLSQDVSTAERETVASAELYVCGQADGSFTIAYGGDKPTYDIPITLILLD